MNKTVNKKSSLPKKRIGKFKKRLPLHRDMLNLNLVMAEQEEKNMRFLRTILHNPTSMKNFCNEFSQPLFSKAITIIHGVASAMVVGEVEYKTGLRKVLKLHKNLEDAFEGFLSNKLLPASFEKDFDSKPREHIFWEKGEESNKAVIQKLDKTEDISSLPFFMYPY